VLETTRKAPQRKSSTDLNSPPKHALHLTHPSRASAVHISSFHFSLSIDSCRSVSFHLTGGTTSSKSLGGFPQVIRLLPSHGRKFGVRATSEKEDHRASRSFCALRGNHRTSRIPYLLISPILRQNPPNSVVRLYILKASRQIARWDEVFHICQSQALDGTETGLITTNTNNTEPRAAVALARAPHCFWLRI
jgi:hypothetical protein